MKNTSDYLRKTSITKISSKASLRERPAFLTDIIEMNIYKEETIKYSINLPLNSKW